VLINSVNVLQPARLKSKLNLQARLSIKVLFSTFFIASILLSQTLFAASNQPICPELTDFRPQQIHQGKVKWIPDGDTIHTQKGHKLRLLHINAPELNQTNNKPAEPLAKASLNKLKQLTTDPTIYWIYDKDRYERELVWVFNQQGVLVNHQLMTSGLAQTLIIPPNYHYWQCFQQAEHRAIAAKAGIWHDFPDSLKSAKKIDQNDGFQRVQGEITKTIDSRKYRWLVLDRHLWVGIKRKDMQYFQPNSLNYKTGDVLRLKGYVYYSYGNLRMNLRHPAMLLP